MVRNATTGAVVSGPYSLASVFGTSSISFGDPRAMYDSVNNRFIVAAFGTQSTASWSYIATAKASGNPAASGWYVFRVSNNMTAWTGCGSATPCFGDYPILGQDANSVWVTTNQFSQISGSYSFAGVGVWGMSKTALVRGATTVPNYAWFLPYGTSRTFGMAPAKASEAGKMHFMATYSNSNMAVRASGGGGGRGTGEREKEGEGWAGECARPPAPNRCLLTPRSPLYLSPLSSVHASREHRPPEYVAPDVAHPERRLLRAGALRGGGGGGGDG